MQKTGTSLNLIDWGAVIPAWREEFCNKFLKLSEIFHLPAGGYEYDKEDDEKDEEGRIIYKGQIVKSGVRMKIAADTPLDPDLNVRMKHEKKLDKKDRPIQKNVGYVFKDRSDTFNRKRFEYPNYRNFKPLVDFIVGLPTIKVAWETFTNNLTPVGDYDYYDKRNKQQIETKIISGIFDKYEHNNY